MGIVFSQPNVINALTEEAYSKLSGRGGVEVDPEGAVSLLEERSKRGDDEAKWMLGLCCEYGMGMKQDVERARLLYEQSFGAGNPVGRFLFHNNDYERGSGMIVASYPWCLLILLRVVRNPFQQFADFLLFG